MRRGGFFTPVAILFTLLAMCAAGFALERLTARFRLAARSADSSSVADAAFLGIKHAEDWLISSVLSEGFPKSGANHSDPDPMRRIEAVKHDGSGVGGAPPVTFAPTPSLYVADADYPDRPFAAPAHGKRSEASDGLVMSVNEELLAVSADSASGSVDVGRLFFRSCSQ